MRILLVRLGALGDVVHAIPVAAALRRSFPESRIDWLVGARHGELLDLVPSIDRRIVVRDRSVPGRGSSLAGVVRELRSARYDVAFDLQGLVKSALLARSSGASRVVGFAARHLREPLARFCYTETCDPGGGGLFDRGDTRHVVQINLCLLRALGVEAGAIEFPIERAESAVADRLRKETGGRYALLNPGAGWPNKRWPPDRLGALAAALEARHGLRSIALWGPGERGLAETVVAHAAGTAVLAPATSIRDLVTLAAGAAVIVSGDTGPLHVAAAVGAPVVGLYGPTRAERNGPWPPEDAVVSRSDVCECHHQRRCRRQTMCLSEIAVDVVLAAVEKRLGAGAEGRVARERARV
jgi:lipopolysaccharide heptosyltransferase I